MLHQSLVLATPVVNEVFRVVTTTLVLCLRQQLSHTYCNDPSHSIKGEDELVSKLL